MPRPLPDPVVVATEGDTEAVRRYILDAACRAIADAGLVGATTRAIAHEAGLAGGTLYNYFDDHTDLLAKSIVHRAGSLAEPVAGFVSRAGRHTVTANLMAFVRTAAEVLDHILPIVAASFANPRLLDRIRREMTTIDPLGDPAGAVERYLGAERELGRISPDADCHAAAHLIVSLCHDDAFQRHLAGGGPRTNRRREIGLVVHALTTPHPTGGPLP